MTKPPPHVFWPALIVTLLVAHAVGLVVVVLVATADPSFSVEEDYYDKALRWDDHARQRRINAELGWSVELAIGPADEFGQRQVVIRPLDDAGAALTDATVEAEAFHISRAGEAEPFEIRSAGAGVHLATPRMGKPGVWELRFVVRTESQRFTEVKRVELSEHGAQPL